MLRAIALATLLAGAAVPALATGGMTCTAGDAAELSFGFGHLPVLNVISASLSVGKTRWSTNPDIFAGTPIAVGQAFQDDHTLQIDLVDANVERVVAQLRVFIAQEAGEYVYGGTLRVPGHGAWPVVCAES